jgi:hypothetical protein
MLVDAHVSPSTSVVEAVSTTQAALVNTMPTASPSAPDDTPATPTAEVDPAPLPPNTLPKANTFVDSIKQWLSSEGKE